MGGEGQQRDAARPFRRVVLCITEDWFALSHFKPLMAALREVAGEVVLVARSSGREAEVAALGVRFIAFDYRRSALDPFEELRSAHALARIVRAERPDVLHLVAMKPIVAGALAQLAARAGVPHAVVHMTGLGFLAISQNVAVRAIVRPAVLRLIGRLLSRQPSWLLVENPEDLAFLEAGGARAPGRTTILGGAGVDPVAFGALLPPRNAVPVVGYVGRMIRPKGVDVLIAAGRLLAARGVGVEIALYGARDTGNPEAVEVDTLEALRDGGRRDGAGVRWHGPVADPRTVWARADIFVLPARSREGMPRAMLEAAACGRPLIVTDVPGCRHFVRDGVEGLVVPPEDAPALAAAIARLAGDPALRQRMGLAARARLLDGYTEADVRAAVVAAYGSLAPV
jgi:glycosyltransferase involved in cell wall biosynthesis